MEDKEQIIIDGINVCECDNFREGYCHPGTGVCYKCDTNCQYAAFYLKEQLARKTQECDCYRKALEEIEEIYKNGVYDEFNMPLDECDFILDIINKTKGESIE